MSDTPEDTLQTDELTAQVDELLEEIDRQAAAVESRMSDEDDLGAELAGILADTGVVESPVADSMTVPEADAAPAIETEEAAEPGKAESEPEAIGHDALVEQLLEEAESLTPPAADTVPSDEQIAEPVDVNANEPLTDLDVDVEALLQETEIQSESSPADEPPPTASDLDDDIEALIESVSEDAEQEEANVPGEVVAGAAAEETVAESERPLAESDEPVPSVEALDEELAAEAEDAIEHQLEGEIETVDLGAVIEQEALGDESDVPEPVASIVEERAAQEPEPVAKQVTATEPTPAADSKTKNSIGSVLFLSEKALAMLSRPLAGLTPRQRDTIGWVALNVLFIAVCVWLVVLMR